MARIIFGGHSMTTKVWIFCWIIYNQYSYQLLNIFKNSVIIIIIPRLYLLINLNYFNEFCTTNNLKFKMI